MNVLEFYVSGLPKGQPRARACIRGKHAATYNPPQADDWKSCIAAAIKDQVPPGSVYPLFDGPTRVDVTLYFPRPKGHFNSKGILKLTAPVYHTGKPDRDNCDKAILDVLTQKAVVRDDAAVCDGKITKLYAVAGQAPGARIHIISLQETQ
jgi:Holliday junction resolvase RusA-like endonuclease